MLSTIVHCDISAYCVVSSEACRLSRRRILSVRKAKPNADREPSNAPAAAAPKESMCGASVSNIAVAKAKQPGLFRSPAIAIYILFRLSPERIRGFGRDGLVIHATHTATHSAAHARRHAATLFLFRSFGDD